MNRRSFITKALAGLAAVPLLRHTAATNPQRYSAGSVGPELSADALWSVLQRADGLPDSFDDDGKSMAVHTVGGCGCPDPDFQHVSNPESLDARVKCLSCKQEFDASIILQMS